ncbi:hypothetical protein BS47DRAFT_807275 [Hydnum rufescens UP504]|uniref:60S acidic ribosomal protein P2 n=1 Tax=Hydnum rufescens UP504 TaxID=1448309 RepID=A0A9P6DXP3_9AGAM|nr:hypothetical protein BS47DRAFT_807275 [Hydnum rufescens UP504]
MRYIAAYLLLQTGGKANPTAADITSLLDTVGIESDSERLSKLLSELEGKSIADLIAEGSSKLSSVTEAPKEEEKKEEKEESDEDMGFGLFD